MNIFKVQINVVKYTNLLLMYKNLDPWSAKVQIFVHEQQIYVLNYTNLYLNYVHKSRLWGFCPEIEYNGHNAITDDKLKCCDNI